MRHRIPRWCRSWPPRRPRRRWPRSSRQGRAVREPVHPHRAGRRSRCSQERFNVLSAAIHREAGDRGELERPDAGAPGGCRQGGQIRVLRVTPRRLVQARERGAGSVTPSSRASARRPRSVRRSARDARTRMTQPWSTNTKASAAPTRPARCGTRSVQSTHARESGLRAPVIGTGWS